MAIARDAVSNGGALGASPKAFNHTCTGSNLILFVSVFCLANSTTTSVTYNGVSMTQIGTQNTTGDGYAVFIFYLINPATGSNSVSITTSSGTTTGVAHSYTGAKQSAQPDANGTTTATAATSITGTLTTIADNCWMVLAASNEIVALAAGTGSTELALPITSTGVFDSNAAITPAGSNGMQATWSGSRKASAVFASFSPYVAAAATGHNLLLTGVGT